MVNLVTCITRRRLLASTAVLAVGGFGPAALGRTYLGGSLPYGLSKTSSDIARFPTISHTDRPGLDRWPLVNAAGDEIVVVHEPRLSASTFPILYQAAIDGIGIGMIPEFSCHQPINEGRLVRVLPDWSRPNGILHMVFTSRRGLLPSVRAVIDFLAEVLDLKSAVWQNAI